MSDLALRPLTLSPWLCRILPYPKSLIPELLSALKDIQAVKAYTHCPQSTVGHW